MAAAWLASGMATDCKVAPSRSNAARAARAGRATPGSAADHSADPQPGVGVVTGSGLSRPQRTPVGQHESALFLPQAERPLDAQL